MESVNRVPSELIKLIPLFDGDCRQLPLYIKKCEYVLHNFQGSDCQNEYLFHVVTSRLAGEAAKIVGEREQISTWSELKQLLRQQFGDPRTEECLVLELESAKINRGENYLDFCHRIQHIRSILFAKLDETIADKSMRLAKQHIYTNTSLNVFLYNLPVFLVRLVRLRNVTTLEEALQTVLEEQNFQNVYNIKNGNMRQNNHPPRHNNPRENKPQNYSHNNHHDRRIPNSDRYISTHNNQHPNRGNRPNSIPFNNFNQEHSIRYNSQGNNPQLHDQLHNHAQSPRYQQNGNNTTRFPQNNQNVATGSGTDATMRTASSRRVNYTNNNDHDELEPNHEIQSVENFYIEASQTMRK